MPNPHILIIEDDPIIQKAYQLKFGKVGIELEAISDGKKALARVGAESSNLPSVVILDLMLPYVSGFELLETMRKTKGWDNVPVIVLSNLSQEVDRAKVEALGVKDYLVKADTRIDDVVAKVKSYLKK